MKTFLKIIGIILFVIAGMFALFAIIDIASEANLAGVIFGLFAVVFGSSGIAVFLKRNNIINSERQKKATAKANTTTPTVAIRPHSARRGNEL